MLCDSFLNPSVVFKLCVYVCDHTQNWSGLVNLSNALPSLQHIYTEKANQGMLPCEKFTPQHCVIRKTTNM